MSKYLYYKVEGSTEGHAALQTAWEDFWDKVNALHQHANAMAKALGFEKGELLQDSFSVYFNGIYIPPELGDRRPLLDLIWVKNVTGNSFRLRSAIPAKRGGHDLRKTAAAELRRLKKVWLEHYLQVKPHVERDIYLKPLGLSCGDMLGQGGLGIFQSDDTKIFYIETNMPMPEFAVEILGSEYREAKEKQA